MPAERFKNSPYIREPSDSISLSLTLDDGRTGSWQRVVLWVVNLSDEPAAAFTFRLELNGERSRCSQVCWTFIRSYGAVTVKSWQPWVRKIFYTILDTDRYQFRQVLPEKLLHHLTTWNKVLFEKLASPQLVEQFVAFYETWWFIRAFTSAQHLSLSRSIQSVLPHPTSWRSIVTLSSHLRVGLPVALFSSVLHTF